MKANRFFTGSLSLVAVLTLLSSATDAAAQTKDLKAQTRAVIGTASASAEGKSAPVKVGAVYGADTSINTGNASQVDLFLGRYAGMLRVTENTTISIDKLALTDTGADAISETQLNLTEGTILGNVNKMSAASKYEIKLPDGVAGIRGTKYRITVHNGRSQISVFDGRVVMARLNAAGQAPSVIPIEPGQTLTPEGPAPTPTGPNEPPPPIPDPGPESGPDAPPGTPGKEGPAPDFLSKNQ